MMGLPIERMGRIESFSDRRQHVRKTPLRKGERVRFRECRAGFGTVARTQRHPDLVRVVPDGETVAGVFHVEFLGVESDSPTTRMRVTGTRYDRMADRPLAKRRGPR